MWPYHELWLHYLLPLCLHLHKCSPGVSFTPEPPQQEMDRWWQEREDTVYKEMLQPFSISKRQLVHWIFLVETIPPIMFLKLSVHI